MPWYKYPLKPFVWAYRQATGTYRNYRDILGSFALEDALPRGVEGLINELLSLIPKAIGTRGAKQQVYASLTLGVLVLLSLPFSLGTSIVLLIFPLTTLFVGLLRMVPAFNAVASDAIRGSALTKDRDVPLWRRE